MTDATHTSTGLAPVQARQIHRVENLQPMLDSDRFEHFQRASKALMHSTILNPSIRGETPEQCFSNLMLVFDLSDRWKLPALSIAQCIAIVHNKVVYEGKLITAMLKASLGFTLDFHYTGERGAKDYRVYVSDRPFEEMTDEQLAGLAPDTYPRGWRIVDGTVGDWQTFQKDGRTVNPAWTGAASKNQLAYRGSREWCRLYEPAQLLGVYGDDEIDTMQIRMDRARDVTPGAPAISSGLSAGFTRPAEAAQVIEAEVTEGEVIGQTTGEVTTQAAGEPQDGQETSREAKPAEKAKAAPAKPKAASKDDVKAKRAAALQIARDMGKAAKELAAWGETDFAALLKSCHTDEERGYVETGFKDGASALAAEAQAAYELGIAGTPILRPDWYAEGDKASERRWLVIHDAWGEGSKDSEKSGMAGDDTSDLGDDDEDHAVDPDSALGAIAEAEPDLVETTLQDHADDSDDAAFEVHVRDESDAIDAFQAGLENLTSWEQIKRSLNALGKTDAWAFAAKETPARIASARRWAWEREAALIEEGTERFDFLNDLTAFRCWIETTDDADAIEGNWLSLVRQANYQGLGPDQKAGLERATMARMQAIKEGAG